MADLDRLEVQVEASAAKANAELNKLVNKLDKVASSLSGINSSGLVGFANGIERLGKSIQTMNAVKTSDFTRLAKNIQKLSTLNTSGLSTASSAFVLFGKSLASFGAASKSAENIAIMAKNISKLGGKSVQNAIDNMPRLAAALKELMTTLAQAPNVSRNVIQMTRALADLSNAVRGAQNSVSANMGNNGATNVGRLSASFSRLSGSITKSGRSMKSFSQMAGRFYVNCFLIIRAIKRLGSAINTAMDYVETYNYFGVTADKIGSEFDGKFTEYGKNSAEKYTKSFTDRMNELTEKMTGYKVGSQGELYMTNSVGLGMDPEKIMNFQAKIGALTNSVGLCGKVSADTADALTRLAGDWSSLANKDLDSVMNNFTSGLLGQSRVMYQYGIDITNTTLQQKAYELGITKSVSVMSQAEKMQLRLLQMLERSKIAYGDMGNTLITVSNQYRIMKQQISNLARIIGNLFLPIVKKVLPVVNGLVIALQRLFTALGFKLWGGNWLKDIMGGTGGGYADDSLGDIADDADDTAEGLGNADKAAKKLAATLLGFDQINKLSDNTDSESGNSGFKGGGSSIDLSGAIGDALSEYESVWDEALKNAQNKAQEYADLFSDIFGRIGNGELGQMITNALNSINWEKIYEGARNFGTGLANFLNSLISPELFGALGKTIASVLNTEIYAALSFGTTFDWTNLGLSIANGVNGFFKTYDFKSLASAINVCVKGMLNSVITAIGNADWDMVGKQIGTFLAELDFLEIGAKIGRAIWEAINAGIIVWENSFSSAPIETMIISALLLLKFTGLGKILAGKIAGVLATAFTETSVVTILSKGIQTLWGNAATAVSFSNPFAAGIAGMGSMKTIAVAITGIGTALAGTVVAVANFFKMWKKGFSWLNEAFMGIGLAIAAVGAVILGAPAVVAAAVAGVVAAIATVAVVIHDNWEEIVRFFTQSIPKFWNDNIAPWFTLEKWKSLLAPIKTAVVQKWNETVGQWTLDISSWWSNHVAPWFKPEKWKNMLHSMVTSFSSKWSEVVKSWKSNISDWWKNHVQPWFTASKWLGAMDGIKEGFKTSFKNAANAAIDVVNRLIRFLNEKLDISWDGFTLPNGDTIGGFSMQLFKISEIPHFASGGYPETGQLFLARENGINEMIGRIGSRSAVANNDQIVEAVSSGVAGAVADVMMAFMGQSSDGAAPVLEFTFKTDSETLYRAVLKGKEKHDRRWHVSAEI